MPCLKVGQNPKISHKNMNNVFLAKTQRRKINTECVDAKGGILAQRGMERRMLHEATRSFFYERWRDTEEDINCLMVELRLKMDNSLFSPILLRRHITYSFCVPLRNPLGLLRFLIYFPNIKTLFPIAKPSQKTAFPHILQPYLQLLTFIKQH